MREERVINKRKQEKRQRTIVQKYFLVFEGEATEVLYFHAVQQERKAIGIHPLIELQPITRNCSEKGWSNPKKIVNRLLLNLRESEGQQITVETLLNSIIDYLVANQKISDDYATKRNLYDHLCMYLQKHKHMNTDDFVENIKEICFSILNCFNQQLKLNHVILNLHEMIENQKITYNKEIDNICLIVDRDKKSFVSFPHNNQFEYVVDICKEHNIQLYLTNPCFEFWLLLHFDQVHQLDKKKLLENEKNASKKTYAQEMLMCYLPQFQKGAYDAQYLVRRLPIAIKNESYFSEEIHELEHCVGSNLGKLFQQLIYK